MEKQLIYFDNASTTQMSDSAYNATINAMHDIYGNASSLNRAGQTARKKLERARSDIAIYLGVHPSEIYFTSGGTESNNQAITSIAKWGAGHNKRHIVTTPFEHHSVLHTIQKLESEGFDITYLDVHENGIVRADEVERAITPDTCLVSVMYANNEIGTIQPIAEIGNICAEKDVYFHTDAVQAVGHLPIDIRQEKIDMLSASSHKFYGTKGIGFLYVNKGTPIYSIMEGGDQENGRRPGTENVPAIIGMAAALKECINEMNYETAIEMYIRDYLIEEISKIPNSKLNGDRYSRLPGNVNFCFEGIEAESLMLLLDREGICVSSGSACSSNDLKPSHVLLSIGVPPDLAHSAIRISLSRNTTLDEVKYLVVKLTEAVESLRKLSPVFGITA